MFNLFVTYYDDVLDCGRYASDSYSFNSYREAVKSFYKAIKAHRDDPMGFSVDFKIKKIDVLLHGDFLFSVYCKSNGNSQHFTSLFRALRVFCRENGNFVKLAFRITVKSKLGFVQGLKIMRGFGAAYGLKIVPKY